MGKELGYQVHIECQGQKGPEYVLTEQEINEADVVLSNRCCYWFRNVYWEKTYSYDTRPVVKDAKQTKSIILINIINYLIIKN